MEDVRGKLEFVPRKEFDSMKRELDELRSRLESLERAGTPRSPGTSQATEPASTAAATESPPMTEAAAEDQPETGATEPTGEHERSPIEEPGAERGGRYRFDVE
jgi:hypothetical protein